MPFWRPFLHGNRAEKLDRKKKMILTRAAHQDYWIRKTSKFIFSDAEKDLFYLFIYFCFVMQSLLFFVRSSVSGFQPSDGAKINVSAARYGL